MGPPFDFVRSECAASLETLPGRKLMLARDPIVRGFADRTTKPDEKIFRSEQPNGLITTMEIVFACLMIINGAIPVNIQVAAYAATNQRSPLINCEPNAAHKNADTRARVVGCFQKMQKLSVGRVFGSKGSVN